MKFFSRLVKAYKLVKEEELTVDYAIAREGAVEVGISLEEAGKRAKEQEKAAIKAIEDYEEYR